MVNISDDNAEPNGAHLAGDWKDDDGAYIDSVVGYDSTPPTPDELPTDVATMPNVVVVSPNRIVAFSMQVSAPMSAPIMALPADTNRERIYITANNTPVLYLADNKTLLPGPTQSAAKFESQYGMAYGITYPAHFVIDGYTGALWFMCDPTAVTPQFVSIMAVTK